MPMESPSLSIHTTHSSSAGGSRNRWIGRITSSVPSRAGRITSEMRHPSAARRPIASIWVRRRVRASSQRAAKVLMAVSCLVVERMPLRYGGLAGAGMAKVRAVTCAGSGIGVGGLLPSQADCNERRSASALERLGGKDLDREMEIALVALAARMVVDRSHRGAQAAAIEADEHD